MQGLKGRVDSLS
jgi:hypothetical protein